MTPVKWDCTTPLYEKLYRGVTSPLRLLPDFLVIGAQRGGTTSLYHYLQAHPCIGPASTKEVHYFDRRFNKSLTWYQGHFPTRVEKYHTQHLSGQTFLTGEATPCYLFYPHAPKRVAQTLPHVKLIVLLRNPVDRAYSQYYHALDHGFATLSFEEAIEREEERAARERTMILQDEYYYSIEYMERGYLSRGMYVDQLQAWMKLFPREQFLILKSEEFYTDPASTIKQVLDFLNVSATDLQISKEVYKPYNNYTYARMNPALRKHLIAYFEPHNARLYDYLGVNFGWDK
ncbi:MAG: sulfotransferase domain-containing protein [Ktedonobacteraceae bacterium]